MTHVNIDESRPNDLWIFDLIRSKVNICQLLNRYRIVKPPQCPIGDCDLQCIANQITSNRRKRRNRVPYEWICSDSQCTGTLPFLSGTYLHGVKLSLAKHVLLIYKYYRGRSAKETSQELGIGYLTVLHWFGVFRKCVHHYMQNDFYPQFQFDVNYAIEWDEAAFAKKQKHHRGNAGNRRRSPKWVLGGVQRRTNFVALKYVEQRDAQTLQTFITQQCPHGATVVTDQWRGYLGLGARGYSHWNVNHENGFVDPLHGQHTNTIEGLWQLVRGDFRKYRGLKKDQLQTYLDEFAFKRNMSLTQEGVWVSLLLVIGAKQRIICGS